MTSKTNDIKTSKLRTFAHDLDVAREKKSAAVIVKPTPTPVVAVTSALAQSKPVTIVTKPMTQTSLKLAGKIPSRPQSKTTIIPAKPADKPKEKPASLLPEKPVKLTASSTRDATYAATIITDNKRKRFKLGSALVESVNHWWQAQKRDYTERKKPKYTVPVVDRRKGVIEKATLTSAGATTHDHHEIVARLRAQKGNGLIAATPPSLGETKPVIPLPIPSAPSVKAMADVVPPTLAWTFSESPLAVKDEEPPAPLLPADKELDLEVKRAVETPIELPLPEPLNHDSYKLVEQVFDLDTALAAAVVTPVTEAVITDSIEPEMMAMTFNLDDALAEIEPELTTAEQVEPQPLVPVIAPTPLSFPKITPTIPVFEVESLVETPIPVESEPLEELDNLDTVFTEIKPEALSVIQLEPESANEVEIVPVIPPVAIITPPTPFSFPKIIPNIPTSPIEPLLVIPKQAPHPSPTLPPVDDVLLAVPQVPAATKAALAARREVLAAAALAQPRREAGGRGRQLLAFIAEPIVLIGSVVIVTITGISYIFLFASPAAPMTDVPPSLPTGIGGLPPIEPQAIPTDAPANTVVDVDGTTKTALFTAVYRARDLSDTISFVTPVQGATRSVLSSRELLTLLNRRLPADFVSNVTTTQLGYVGTEPVLVLSISDEKIAQGGMFAWERTLSENLSPWFGAPVSGTSLREAEFSDGSSGDTDIRLLSDQTAVRIVYSIERGVIVITTNEASLTVARRGLSQTNY